MTGRALRVDCPTCARPTEYSPKNPWRPFCSARCRSVDLGAWASERFRIANQADPDDSGDDGPVAPTPTAPGA